MLRQSKSAVLAATALRQLVWLVLADVVAFALAFMAALAEMSRAPAEPLRDRATVPALKLNEVSAVHLAVLLSIFDSDR